MTEGTFVIISYSMSKWKTIKLERRQHVFCEVNL